jgi:hypothetical protein
MQQIPTKDTPRIEATICLINQELAFPVVKNALSTKASYNAPRYYRRLRAREIVVTRDEAWKLAEHRIAAWNAHGSGQAQRCLHPRVRSLRRKSSSGYASNPRRK